MGEETSLRLAFSTRSPRSTSPSRACTPVSFPEERPDDVRRLTERVFAVEEGEEAKRASQCRSVDLRLVK